MAPVVKKEWLPTLDLLVSEILSCTVEEFGDVLTPKCHYLIHYSRLLLCYGPLRSLWCLRFEGKHQYFKQVASACKNFSNISSTLSNRHQHKQCWELSSVNMLGEYEKVAGCCVNTPFQSLPSALQHSISVNSHVNFEGKQLQRVTEVESLMMSNIVLKMCLLWVTSMQKLFLCFFRLSTFFTWTQTGYCVASC